VASRAVRTTSLVRFPFKMKLMPVGGVYFFYEDGEVWGHNMVKLRIVRVSIHRGGSLRDHIKEHRLLDEALMNLDVGEPKIF